MCVLSFAIVTSYTMMEPASLWSHENDTDPDPGVFLGTHLSTSHMFIPSMVFAYKARKTPNHFSLDHTQSHVLAKCNSLNKNVPHRLR